MKDRIRKISAHMEERFERSTWGYILGFTLLYVLTAAFVFWPFFAKDRTFIYTNDGYYQHYNSLLYYGTYLRSLLVNLVKEHRFVMPMLDMRIGFGSDVLSTLNYYVMGDPLYLLTALVPGSLMEYFFGFLIIFRAYLAGLSFSAFSISRGGKRSYTMAGALTYCFCGYFLTYGTLHIMFQPAMIYLPLVLMGIDRILEKNRPLLFTLSAAIAAASNFYFFYIIVCFGVLYALFRYFTMYPLRSLRETGAWISENLRRIGGILLTFLRSGLLAAGIAAIVLLPVLSAMLSSRRMDIRHYLPLLYEWKYYLVNFAGFMTTQYVTEGTFYTSFGFTAMGVFGVLVLFSRKKEDSSLRKEEGPLRKGEDLRRTEEGPLRTEEGPLRKGFLLCLIFAMLPFCGYALSAFTYVNNRWSFAFALLVSLILVRMLPKAERLQGRSLAFVILAAGAYGILTYISATDRAEVSLAGLAILFAAIALAASGSSLAASGSVSSVSGSASAVSDSAPSASGSVSAASGSACGSRFVRRGFVLLTVLAVIVNAHFAFGDLDGRLKRGAPTQNTFHSPAEIIGGLKEEASTVRYDADGVKECQNQSWHHNVLSTNFYYSILNGNVSEFFTEYELNNPTEYSFNGLNRRGILDLAASVRYSLIRKDDPSTPGIWSYDSLVTSEDRGDVFEVYESDLALPLGYTYDRVLPASEYQEMDALTKQEVLLQSVALEGVDGGSADAGKAETGEALSGLTGSYTVGGENLEHASIPYEMTFTDGVTQNDGGFFVSEEGAQVTLTFDGLPDSETYLHFSGLTYEDINPYALTGITGSTVYDRMTQRREERNYIPEDTANFKIEAAGCSFGTRINNYRQPAYSGKEDFLFNTCYSKEGLKEITLTFTRPGYYRFTDLQVACQPMGRVAEYADARRAESLQDVTIGTNEITGSIHVSGDKLLCLSIPYSKGFTAYVDGVKTKLYRANTMYMALELTEGDHQVRLVYETPLLRIGALITLLSLLILAATLVLRKRRTNSENTTPGKDT